MIINKKFDNIDLATGNQDFLCYYQTEWVLSTPIPFLIISFSNRFDDELIFHSLQHGNCIKWVNLSEWVFAINNGDNNIIRIIIIPEQMPEPEPIHTYQAWKQLGYQVQRGQKAKASFLIWKHTVKKAKQEQDEDEEKMFMTKAFFFTFDQVEPIQEKTADI